MQDQRCKKEGRSYSLQCGPEGNGHRRLGRGMSPVGPTTSKGALPVGEPILKSGCLGSGSHETAIMLVFHNVELRREPRPSSNKIIERQ